ncbi:hypothetical protein MASR1M12_43300 [Erysipelotrichia bacterium]
MPNRLQPAPAVEEMYYFDMKRANVLVIIITLMAFVTYYTFLPREVKSSSSEESVVCRLSKMPLVVPPEMGRGVLYIPGIMDMDDIQTSLV